MNNKKENTKTNTTKEQGKTNKGANPRITRVANPKRPPRKPPDNLSDSGKPDNPPKTENPSNSGKPDNPPKTEDSKDK